MNTKTILAIVIVIVLVVAGYYLTKESKDEIMSQTPNINSEESTDSNAQQAAGQTTLETSITDPGLVSNEPITIRYTDEGFSPSNIDIKVGTTVTWINEATIPLWVASADHPTHITYSGTSLIDHCPDTAGTAFDQCSNGDSYTFTFNKSGTWYYHNHTFSASTGSITVTPN